MKNILCALISFLILTFSNVSLANAQSEEAFSKLTLTISSSKESVMQLEPIPLKMRLGNNTSAVINGHAALDFTYAPLELFVTHNGVSKKIERLSFIKSLTEIYTKRIQPGQHFESQQLLTIDLDKFFPEPGSYQLQVHLYDIQRKELVKSNILTLNILRPQGIDLLAFNYLQKNGLSTTLFTGADLYEQKKLQKQLREFTINFRASSYGDYTAWKLGVYYFNTEDYAAAVESLETLANKQEFVFADGILFYLTVANQKVGNIEKTKGYLKTFKEKYPSSQYMYTNEMQTLLTTLQ